MKEACKKVFDVIKSDGDILVNVDADCDGFTSAAIFINYFYSRFSEYTKEHIHYILHKGKEHGLSDLIDEILEQKPVLVICPDSASNDILEHWQLKDNGIECLVLDHHEYSKELDEESPATIVNIQGINSYPNKALTGAGVTYKFVSAFEDLYIHGFQPVELMDLCALGNCGDMSSLKEIETRAIMNIGLAKIKNPFFYEMADNNEYSIQKMNGINYYSVAFYVVPFINSAIRSGTSEEKELIFKSMLTMYAFDEVESSKRGMKGKKVPLYKEAITVADRVKRRQTKLQDESMALLEQRIKDENLLDHKIIMLLCEPGEVEKNLAGLVANRIQSKYQKPCLVLIKTKLAEDKEYVYRGSARNYSFSSEKDLRGDLLATNSVDLAQGHANAAGCWIKESQIDDFIETFDYMYRNIDQTPYYLVDYIWDNHTIDGNKILDISYLNIYGQEIPESYIALDRVYFNPSDVTLMSRDKNPTLKVKINGIDCIKFRASEEEYEKFIQPNQVMTAICKPNHNEWNGNISPQLIIEDYTLDEEWIF